MTDFPKSCKNSDVRGDFIREVHFARMSTNAIQKLSIVEICIVQITMVDSLVDADWGLKKLLWKGLTVDASMLTNVQIRTIVQFSYKILSKFFFYQQNS